MWFIKLMSRLSQDKVIYSVFTWMNVSSMDKVVILIYSVFARMNVSKLMK